MDEHVKLVNLVRESAFPTDCSNKFLSHHYFSLKSEVLQVSNSEDVMPNEDLYLRNSAPGKVLLVTCLRAT